MPTRIIQISDVHFTHVTLNPLRLLCKRLFGTLNWALNRKDEYSWNQLEQLPALFEELKVDLILLGGDFTTTALEEEFEKARLWVDKLPAPWIAIPGNHDKYTRQSEKEGRFYRYFKNPSLQRDGLELTRCGDYSLIAMDTTIATKIGSSEGLFSPMLEKKLTFLLNSLPQNEPVILFTHYPFFQNDAKKRALIRGKKLEELLCKFPQVRLYLHGHTHRHIIANLQPSHLPVILDSGSAAHTQFGFWNLIDLLPNGCEVTPYRWDQQWKPQEKVAIAWTRF
jgi:3',5'-cyclic AMP phosphodiesterase CpdA